MAPVDPSSLTRSPLISVLGPFHLGPGAGDGRLSPRQRAVVTALVLGDGKEVDASTIVDGVWGDAPPPTARKALQVHMVAVRAVLGADRVVTTASGYRLAADRAEVDVWWFEDLVRGAVRTPGGDGDDLALALRLWRGSPYGGVEHHGLAGHRVRLVELHAVAIDLRAERLLSRGRPADAVRVLEPAALDDPVRERRWALLMVGLHRSGRRVEALRAYQRARHELVTATGLEPGRLLRSLERLVLDDDPRLWSAEVLDDPGLSTRPHDDGSGPTPPGRHGTRRSAASGPAGRARS